MFTEQLIQALTKRFPDDQLSIVSALANVLDRQRYPPSNPPGPLDTYATRDLADIAYSSQRNNHQWTDSAKWLWSVQTCSEWLRQWWVLSCQFVMLHCHQETGSTIPGLCYASKNCLGDPHDQCACRKRVQHPEHNQNRWPKSTQRGACYKINDAEHSWKRCDRFWRWCCQQSFFWPWKHTGNSGKQAIAIFYI